MRLFGSVPVGGGVRVGMSGYGGGPVKDDRTFRVLMFVLPVPLVILYSLFNFSRPVEAVSSAYHIDGKPTSAWREGVAKCDAAHGNYVADDADNWTCIK